MNHIYNWNIVGHDNILGALERDLETGNISHAYLFAGAPATGKFTVAKTMAHILQCPNNFCHRCSTCNEIEKGYHSDTIETADNGELIKIEEVRETIARLNMSRAGAYKILLIQNIERMKVESANTLLKTLEDPPDGVIFLLTTSRLREILPTIISRVRVLNFQRLPEQKIIDLLRKEYPLAEEDLLSQASSFAMGSPGKAISFMRQPELLDGARKMYNDICIFMKKPDRANEFAYIADLVKASKEDGNAKIIRDFLDFFTSVARKSLLEAGSAGDYARAGKTAHLVKEAQKAQDLLKRNVNTKLLLENLMLLLC